MERRLTAILAADVVGYSKLMAEDQQGTLAILRYLRGEVFGPLVQTYRGNLVKSMGDGWLVEFPSISDAVGCALGVQTELEDHEKIKLRIGIHTGEVVFEDEDVFGDGVNLASRLQEIAKPGQITVSDNAFQSLDGKTASQFRAGAQQNLKNIPRPVAVWYWPESQLGQHQPQTSRNTSTGANAPRLSIVLLPIISQSGDSEQDYFVDALSEDLTSDLSRISGSFVVARGTAATYRGTAIDPKIVSKELGVRYVLEGTLRKLGPNFRVSMILSDGTTGQQIWTERYERSVADMYRLQDEVTGRIARTLNLELKNAVSRQVERGVIDNLEAADLAVRAWAELWTKPQTQSSNDAALDFATQALRIDAANAEAGSSLAYAYARAALYGWGPPRATAIQLGIEAGEKSLECDPKGADAAFALALLYFAAGENFHVQELLERCLDLNRNHAPAYFLRGSICLRLGRPTDTLDFLGRAFALSPRDPLRAVWHGTMARAHFFLGDYELAVQEAQKGTAANRDHVHNYSVLAAAFVALERVVEARKFGVEFQTRLHGQEIDQYISEVTSEDPVAQASYAPFWAALAKAVPQS